jgi:hypothetical protein
MMNLKFKVLIFLLICKNVGAQNIPVGSIDYTNARLRNEQLLGRVDSLVSFCLYPLPQSLINNAIEKVNAKPSDKFVAKILPFKLIQQFNTFSPIGRNDGGIIPAKGYQILVSAGYYVAYRSLRIQFKPEYVLADNPNFNSFPTTEKDQVRLNKITYLNFSDIPERLGENPYHKVSWGESSIKFGINNIDIGLSTENLWWGPGQQNSLIMSNNAPGFFHISINTRKPIRTFVGSFEGQLISGKLEGSGLDSADEDYIVDGINYKMPKAHEWRYLSGLTINYQPKWVPGLFIGLNRVFQIYNSDLGNGFSDYFPVITPFQKNNLSEEDAKKRDQLASLFFRWFLKESRFELYFENGWNDHSSTLWDLFESPEHSRAYLFGFNKIFILNSKKDSYLKLNYENTQLQQSADRIVRPAGAWYLHGPVRHGYTQMSQVIGAGIGPGGNMQTLDFSLWKKDKVFGFQCERYAHNMDFYYETYKDYNRKWVDLCFNAYAYRRIGKIDVQAKLNTAWMSNYEWQPNDDKFNMQVLVSFQYNF